MTIQRKEKVQYITAVGFLITGVIICFLSFFLNAYTIDNGSLWYLGQSVAFCAAVFSVNLVVKNEMMKVEDRLNKCVEKKMKKVDDLLED